MKHAVDLYSGIGGWTMGMKLSNISNVSSYEWWAEANKTHNLNFDTKHEEIDIRKIDISSLSFTQDIDYVVGSPPCTQFSYSNKGGKGDIEDGLVDIKKFLDIVKVLKPKYWAMENVPRVAKILKTELEKGGALESYKKLVKTIIVVNCADYGVPQKRKRMIAGNFPVELFNSYKNNIRGKSLGDVLSSLKGARIVDINYGYELSREEITELENEVDLTKKEERINRDAKTFHPVYNGMSFPDRLSRSSRTVTATCTRVSRESIIVQSKKGFRRLNVRERGIIQGFPITFQFYGKSLNAKFKMIGNAVPPILTYYIFQSMLGVSLKKLTPPECSNYFHEIPKEQISKPYLGLPKRKYPKHRSFKFAVPYLRYGSGVRFELSNDPKKKTIPWCFKFYYGNSKNIRKVELDDDLRSALAPIVNTNKNLIFNSCLDEILSSFSSLDSTVLQEKWISDDSNFEIFEFLDKVGECVENILIDAKFSKKDQKLLYEILDLNHSKLELNASSMLTGFYLLSSINHRLFKA